MDKELKILEKNGYVITDIKPTKRTEIKSLFVYVHDLRKRHDSGYPYIKIFGEIENKQLIDLGWHDHYLINNSVNIDAYGKNLFHIFKWRGNPFWISGNNILVSTFSIDTTGELR